MVDKNSEELLKKVASLSEQERKVLELVCEGLSYAAIAEKMYLSLSSVKQYMGRVYMKLGLKYLTTRERLKVIFQVYCPLLEKVEPPSEPEKIEVVEVVPSDIEELVNEDEEGIVVWQSTVLQKVTEQPKHPRKNSLLRWLIVVGILGCLGIALVFFVISNLLENFPIEQSPDQPIPDSAFTEAVEAITQSAIESQIIPTEIQTIQTVSSEPTAQIPTETLQPPPTNTQLPSATPTLRLQLPFTDNFDNGASPSWQPVSSKGVWRVINGKYTYTGGKKFNIDYNLVGDKNWQNYIIDVDYSLENDIYAGLAVIVRARGPGNLGLAFFIIDGSPVWRIWQAEGWQTLVEGKNFSYDPNHIRVEVNESRFYGSVSGLGELEITDTSTTSGMVGLAVYCRSESGCPEFDNFSVTVYNP